MLTTELADKVREYRHRAGMSQEELAHAAGVSPGTVRKAEQGGTIPEGHCLLAGPSPLRVPEPGNELWPLLDAVADANIPEPPGTASLLGPGTFTSTPAPAQSCGPGPRLLRIKVAEAGEQVPTAQAFLHLAADDQEDPVLASSIWDGHPALSPAVLPRVRRALRGRPPLTVARRPRRIDHAPRHFRRAVAFSPHRR